MLQVKDFCIFAAVVFAWLFVMPLCFLAVACGAFWMLCLLPFSFALSRRLVRQPTVPKSSFLRKLLSAIAWRDWFSATPAPALFGRSIVCVHPHGLLSLGTLALVHFVPASNTVMAVAPILFYIPLFGLLGPSLGLVPSNKAGLLAVLKSDRTLLILPGGVPEILCGEEQKTLFISPRVGLFKIAFHEGRDLQIIIVDGEERMFRSLRLPFLKERMWLSWAFNFPVMLPWFGGCYGSFVPRPHHLAARPLQLVEVSKAQTFFGLKREYETRLQQSGFRIR